MSSGRYRQIFQFPAFRAFWLSFTLSVLGDGMSRVALTWYVYEITKSPEALGLLSLTYTGPVIIGGLIAGTLLDRFDRRKVMIADNLIRGVGMLLIPILYAFGALALWHIYVISTIYGALVMFSLAGSPALVPDLVDEEHLSTANALETLSYTVSGVVGPPIAGLLIPLISAPNVVILDALSYLIFAFVLMQIRVPVKQKREESVPEQSYGLGDAVRLLLNNRVLLSTTLMFMSANLGMGAMGVWLPIVASEVLGGGSQVYGLLLGALAVGEVISAFLAGSLRMRYTLGTSIVIAQILSGVALGLLVISITTPVALLSLALLGLFSAPLTIWAQTLRMKVIPNQLRGRTFALLRTMMQSTNPLGGVVAGMTLPLMALPMVVAFSALLIGVPGLLGYNVKALREAD